MGVELKKWDYIQWQGNCKSAGFRYGFYQGLVKHPFFEVFLMETLDQYNKEMTLEQISKDREYLKNNPIAYSTGYIKQSEIVKIIQSDK